MSGQDQLWATLATRPTGARVRRIEVADLTDYQAAALVRATVEQAAYRIQRTDAEMSQDQDGIASVGGISFSVSPPPRIGPAVREALQGAGLFLRSGTAPAEEAA